MKYVVQVLVAGICSGGGRGSGAGWDRNRREVYKPLTRIYEIHFLNKAKLLGAVAMFAQFKVDAV